MTLKTVDEVINRDYMLYAHALRDPEQPWHDDFVFHPELATKGEYRGVPYEMKRNFGFCWCGYITIPEGISSDRYADFPLHGGITAGGDHMVGFDTNHLGDLSPLGEALVLTSWFPRLDTEETYRDYDYTLNQIQGFIDHMLRDDFVPEKDGTATASVDSLPDRRECATQTEIRDFDQNSEI